MKKYLISGYDYPQDVLLDPGTYTIVVTVKSMFGDIYSFALSNGTEKEYFDIETKKDEWCKIYLTFDITEKKTVFYPIARYYDEAHKVFVYKPQLVKGNIPSEPGASPFDIDQITDDLHDQVGRIADFTNEEFADRVISASERVSLKRDLEAVEAIFQSLKGSYEKLLINPFISEVAMADLQTNYSTVVSAKSLLFTVINGIIDSDDIITDDEILAKDNALAQFNIALYNYNQAEKEIYNDLAEDYTQQIAEIRDFTDQEFTDRMLSETEKVSLSHDLDNVQLLIDEITAVYNETLENPYLGVEDKSLLQEKYFALLDAWELADDPVKPDGLKTVILDIINGDEIVSQEEIDEKDLALSAFNAALSYYSTTETSLRKVAIDNSISQASWEIHTSSPVIYKDAPDLTTDGAHTPVTVTGRHWVGSTMTEEGFITVTANDETEALTASPSPVTIAPADNADKHTYTIRLYNDANKTELLDWETIPVVFKGAKGINAIRLHINNPVDVLPADSDGNVLTFAGTGTSIHVFEGAVELDYDGIGTTNGKFKVTAVATNITIGAMTDSGNVCVVADATAMPVAEEKASIVYTITGKTLDGFDFTITGEQNFSKTKMGEDGDGILSTTIEYAKSSSGTTAPTSGWSTSVPSPTLGWYLWTRTTTTYKLSPTTVAYSVSRWGNDGADGESGTGVSSVRTEYYLSTSSTSQVGGTWQTTVPTWTLGKYIWERLVTVKDDGTESVGTPYLSQTWENINQLKADLIEEQAKTQYQTTIEGGLIYTAMMKLFDGVTETAGISGLQGENKDNPSFWSGGSNAQAFGLIEFLYNMSLGTPAGTGTGQFDYATKYAALAKIIMLHNGAGKYGDFIVLENGVIVIIDPDTGKQRVMFAVQDLPSLTTLLSTTNPSGYVDYPGTSSNGALGSGINVTEDGSTIVFGTQSGVGSVPLTLSATFAPDAPYTEIVGKVNLMRDGIFYTQLGYVNINNNKTTDSSPIPKITLTNCPKGLYTVVKVTEWNPILEVTNVTHSIGDSRISWEFLRTGVRRFQFGRNGFMAFYSLLHLYLSEEKGLDIKGATNMPGVLLSATVASGGGASSVWGAKKSTTNATKNSTGRYTVYHTVGHSNYQVYASAHTASMSHHIVSKGTTNFVIEWRTIGSSPALVDTTFDCQIVGNNY